MNPNDVIIPETGVGNTREEIQSNIESIVAQLQTIYPYLKELAIAFQSASEGVDKDQALSDFLALDEKRRQIDDVLASQNQRLLNLGE